MAEGQVGNTSLLLPTLVVGVAGNFIGKVVMAQENSCNLNKVSFLLLYRVWLHYYNASSLDYLPFGIPVVPLVNTVRQASFTHWSASISARAASEMDLPALCRSFHPITSPER